MNDYCYGAAHEIYAGSFSQDFIGLKFTEAAEWDCCLLLAGLSSSLCVN